MTATLRSDLENQAQEMWGARFMKQLRAMGKLAGLCNRDYEGEISTGGGDTVHVSQVNAPEADILDIGVDDESFNTKKMSTSRVSVVADKRIVAGHKIHDLVKLQTQLGQQESEILDSLVYAAMIKLNNYLYSLVSPSSSTPDHVINGVSDFNSAAISAYRILAGEANWPADNRWYALATPSYYGDARDDAVLASQEYGQTGAPVIDGEIRRAHGFWLMEDNTPGIRTSVSGASNPGQGALLFHPDFLYLVMQTEPRFKISDLHATGSFGENMTVDFVFGAKLGIDGNKKHIRVYNS